MMEMEFYKIIFEEVLRLSDDGFIVVDKHAIVTDINDRYSAFLGKPKEEIIGRPITDVIPNSKMADIMRKPYLCERFGGRHDRRCSAGPFP